VPKGGVLQTVPNRSTDGPRQAHGLRARRARAAIVLLLSLLIGAPRGAEAVSPPPAAVRNLSLWYDASDASTITVTTSYVVSALNDKSGNGAALQQPTSAAQPQYRINGLNGLSTLVFNGSSDYLYRTSGFPTSSDFTIVFLGQMSGATSNNMLSDYSTGTSPASHAFFGNNGTTPSLFANGSFVTSTSVGTTPFVSVATYSNATHVGNIYNNGATSPATGSNTASPTDASIEIGSFHGAGNYLTGMLGEALVYSRVLTTAERQMLEGYLACKWGLQTNLPATHPYAASCPSAFTPASLTNLAAWYDAGDASTMTLVATGSGVTHWNDKSGNAVSLAAPAAQQYWPVWTSNGINGLAALVFSGGQYLYATSGFPTGSDYTIAAVALFSSTGINNNILSSYLNSGTTHALYGNGGNGGTTPTLYQSGDAVIGATVGTATFLAVGTSKTGTGAVALYLNGGSATSATASSRVVTDGSVEAGGYTGAANFLGGDVAEALVYHAVLSTAERQFVEGYLACKWVLQSSLPATHPYKSVCPSTAAASLNLVLTVSPAGMPSPGAVLTYTSTFTNASATIDYDPVINAAVPAQTVFAVGSATTSLGSTGLTGAVTYSQDGGSTYAYTPVSGGGGAPAGYDATVTNVRWVLHGALAPGAAVNSGSASYAVAVQ
jgi:hypothetical protein